MTYLVGYSPHKDDTCALELACELARTRPETVHAVTVVPRGWETSAGSQQDGDFTQWARQEGESSAAEALAALRRHPEIDSRATWVTGRSVPAAILAARVDLGASMVVVGSGQDGQPGRVSVTSKTDRILHSSKVPVVIAPRGYHPAPDSRISRLTVGFRDDDATRGLMDLVADLAQGTGASVRLVTIALRMGTMVTAGIRDAERLVHDRLVEQARAAQSEAVARLHGLGLDPTRVSATVVPGASWSDAMEKIEWSAGDMLVVGSSATHPLAEVFLGSSATKIVRNSPVPTMALP